MKFGVLTVVAAALGLMAGCADPVVMAEVLQLREGQKIYTNYNLWYTDPADISCLNIQQGAFIPLGTEVEPVGTSRWGDTITFRDKLGKTYVIKFRSGYRLCTMADFIAYTFTTKNREELLDGISEEVKTRIERGEVVPGMSQREVLLAYGPPPGCRTPSLRNETWIYWISDSRTVRLVFRGDKVRNILNINEN